jgi:hypothetical protein
MGPICLSVVYLVNISSSMLIPTQKEVEKGIFSCCSFVVDFFSGKGINIYRMQFGQKNSYAGDFDNYIT